jgi:hypothetical protein
VRVADPVGFTYAFGKLEQAIGELVGAGDVKERLKVATMTLAPIFPDDFPAGHLRDEYADIRQALMWLPPEEGRGQGLLESTLEAMTEEEAGMLAKSLFTVYTSAAEALHER